DSPENLTFDPCNFYRSLDHEWRTVNRKYYFSSYSGHDDTLVEWSGWHRLYLQGKSAQIPESDWCYSYISCGGYTALFLNGTHPRLQDGIVTRGIYGTYDSQCNFNRSNPIQVKACPGDYYVYRLVKPAVSLPLPTYCAVVFNTLNYDPCNNYTALDQPWRGTNETGLWICDSLFKWTGWYRLLYYGMNIHMPESCVNESRCGTDITLWLNGRHPQIGDDIVTRGVCGRSGSDCCYYRSTPIRVKACPGNYYVYEFVRPVTCDAAYCADQNNTSDPCSVYSVLDDDWRVTDSMTYNSFDDTLVEWSGWYRLYLRGRSAQIPESDWCWSFMTCGGYTSLLLGGSHPRLQDGIVTREVYGTYVYSFDSSQCNSYRSKPIQVKACPGNYYVYRLVKPPISLPMPTYCAVVFDTPSYDPCTNYTSLDQQWRGTTEIGGFNSDSDVNWNGWYRLLYNGRSVRMPESCVDVYRCGTYFTLSLNGSHPEKGDEIVTRGVCVNVGWEDCCYYRSIPIRVKACPGDFYVYEFVSPTFYFAAYCAGIQSAEANAPPPSMNSAQQDKNFNQISENSTGIVGSDCFAAGLNMSSKDITQISINNAQMDIDLIQISRNNNDSAAVAFMSYTNLSSVLKPSLFNTTNNTNTVNTLMSTVITATLLRIANPQFTTPVNFTLKHIAELDPNGVLFCVYWKDDKWAVDGCALLWTNSSHTVCSCVHLSTFALIMQTGPLAEEEDSDPVLELIGIIAVAVGLIFLSLALLTFAVCRRNPRVTSIPQINLCINLLLAHLLFLLTQNLLRNQHSQRLACAVMAGVVHYFFLAAFVWMLIEAAVLLFHMKNLTKLRSKKQGGHLWKWLVVIGYAVPLVVVGVSAGVVPHGYDRDSCWLKADVLWSFLGPVSFILAANTVIFICILVIVISTLTNMKSKALKIKRPKSEHRVLTSVALKTTIQFIILGCSWILGFFTQDSKAMEIIFLLLNSQQGTFIFFIYCVFNQEVSHHLLYLHPEPTFPKTHQDSSCV
ncbi:hypothetical protein NFI96_003208, partial [Prochilodus magdalenae]